MSRVSAIYHIVFCTKFRQNTISLEYKDDLYRVIYSYIKETNSVLYRINGMENHIHILIDLHPSIALAPLVAKIKANTSGFLKKSALHPKFQGWANGYYAASVSYKAKSTAIEYIKNQQNHHSGQCFDEELRLMAESVGMELSEEELR